MHRACFVNGPGRLFSSLKKSAKPKNYIPPLPKPLTPPVRSQTATTASAAAPVIVESNETSHLVPENELPPGYVVPAPVKTTGIYSIGFVRYQKLCFVT